jgi:hypothetical protein
MRNPEVSLHVMERLMTSRDDLPDKMASPERRRNMRAFAHLRDEFKAFTEVNEQPSGPTVERFEWDVPTFEQPVLPLPEIVPIVVSGQAYDAMVSASQQVRAELDGFWALADRLQVGMLELGKAASECERMARLTHAVHKGSLGEMRAVAQSVEPMDLAIWV